MILSYFLNQHEWLEESISNGGIVRAGRAGQFLVLAAKARAILEGRIHVSCADIKRAAIPVLRHRLYTNVAADSEGLSSVDAENSPALQRRGKRCSRSASPVGTKEPAMLLSSLTGLDKQSFRFTQC